MPLEDITVYLLEEYRIRLDNVAFAVDMDILRAPSHKQLFEDISNFRQQLDEVITFFESLPEDTVRTSSQEEAKAEPVRSTEKMYADLAFQERILLFYLKGEIEKLEKANLIADRKAIFAGICWKLKDAVSLAGAAGGENAAETGNAAGKTRETEADRVVTLLWEVYSEMTEEAGQLGAYGGVIQYIAEEIKRPLKYFSV